MKKTISLFLCSFLVGTCLFAENFQGLYNGQDRTYLEVKALCTLAGVSGPSTATPVTAAQLINALQSIDTTRLSQRRKDQTEKLLDTLLQPQRYYKNTDLHLYSSFGFTGETSSDLKKYESAYTEQETSDLIDAYFNAYMGDNMTLTGSYLLRDRIGNPSDSINTIDNTFNFITTSSVSQELYVPYKAGISTGNDNINFQLGRGLVSEGDGITGNLKLSSNLTFQDYAKLTVNNDFLLYALTVIQYGVQDSSTGSSINPFLGYSNSGYKQYFLTHRAEINVQKNLRINIGQSSMLYVEELGLSTLIPMLYPHNFFNYTENDILSDDNSTSDEANNSLSAEVEYTFFPSWSLYAQIYFDQIQLSSESTEHFPNALGFMTNIKHISDQKFGLMTTGLEFVYTYPYLYLNRKYNTTETIDYLNYNYDFIVGYRGGDSEDYQVSYTGYQYGPDALVVSLDNTILFDQKSKLNSRLTYILKGPYGISYYDDGATIYDYIPSDFSTSAWLQGPLQTRIIFKNSGQYKINKRTTIDASCALVSIFNRYYTDTNKENITFAQGSLSFSIDMLP